jgi:hypothetical protein
MVQLSWSRVPVQNHEAKGEVFVTCEAFQGCSSRLYGEGMRRLRPDAQRALDRVKIDMEVRLALRTEVSLGQRTILQLIEKKIESLFIPKCPWCGVAGAFDFTQCMVIICGCGRHYCGYCLERGDAHAHAHVQSHSQLFDGINAAHATACTAAQYRMPEPMWTCEPRWRVAWYRIHGLETTAIHLYGLIESFDDYRSSWNKLLADVASFPPARM